MKSKPEKTLEMNVLMTADMAYFGGNVHGGKILSLLDNVAYACALRYCKRYVVTLSVDQMFFKEPIHVGDLVTFKAGADTVSCVSKRVREAPVRPAPAPTSLRSGTVSRACINYTGKTSMEVGIRVEAEHIRTGRRRHTNTCYFTMVALDDERHPVEVPPLELETDEERDRHAAAERRRDQRKANAARSASRP